MKVVTFFDLDVVRRRRIGDWSGGGSGGGVLGLGGGVLPWINVIDSRRRIGIILWSGLP